jgi:hypothetical protein
MGMLRCFDRAIIGIPFDELVFDIGVTSMWRYFYNVQGTGRSATAQICVTPVWCVHGGRRRVTVILEVRDERGFSVAEVCLLENEVNEPVTCPCARCNGAEP